MNVYYLSLKPETPNNDYWDYGFLNDFIAGGVWQLPGFPKFKTHEVDKLPKDDSAIVVVPARHHAGFEEKINTQLQRIDNVVLFLMGDEEADFVVEKIEHPSIHVWVQNPHPGRHDQYDKLGTTYPPQSQQILPKLKPSKKLNAYFSGQITHKRRQDMWDIITHYESEAGKCKFERTRGFTQGVPHEQYYQDMVSARVVPCPSGAVIPDSFRLFEALECMAVPFADNKNSQGTVKDYWEWLFDSDVPFPRINEWDRFYGLMNETLDEWPENVFEITAWWIKYKREFAYKVKEQLDGTIQIKR